MLGVLGHLTASHRAGGPTADEIATFAERLVAARDRYGASVQSSLFASHGIPRWSVAHPTDWVRPGLALAGEHCFTEEVLRTDPGAFELAERLRPAVRIRARLIHVMATTRTEGVGYGTRPSVTPGRRLACATIGFRSGLPEGDETTPAICRGQLVARAGALGMDSMQLDVTDVDDAAAGDWVTLAGRDGRQEVRLAAIWRAAGLTPYQLLARLRLPRAYPATTIQHHEEER